MGYQNFFATKLFTDIGAGDTTITLETPPVPTSGRLVLEARNATQREIIRYTGVSGNQITGVTRGQGGTTAKSHVKNSLVEMNAIGEDLQDIIDAFNSFAPSAGSGWITSVNIPTTITALGNRSYTVLHPSSVLAYKSVGMRNKYTRTVTAPTQCADLESSSSQYFSRAAPTGMTFTDDFTCMGWVKLESYTGGNQRIVTRADTAYNNGFGLIISGTGQVYIAGRNAGGGREANSQQSVPIGRWVHIAASLDMSANTGAIYIDGVSVPVVMSGAATSLVQSGDLNVGSRPLPGDFLDGKVAQVAVFSSVLSAATIRSYMSQSLTGAEATAAAVYRLSNSVNDLTANANHLTANGGALTTSLDSPFAGGDTPYNTDGTTEFSITTAISSDGLTETVQVPEGYALPTTGGVSAVGYSTHKAPYGFPTAIKLWKLTSIHYAQASQIANINTWYNIGGQQLAVPAGEWRLRYQTSTAVAGTATIIDLQTLSTANNSQSNPEFTTENYWNVSSTWGQSRNRVGDITNSVLTTWYLNRCSTGAGTPTFYNVETALSANGASPSIVEAECAYL